MENGSYVYTSKRNLGLLGGAAAAATIALAGVLSYRTSSNDTPAVNHPVASVAAQANAEEPAESVTEEPEETVTESKPTKRYNFEAFERLRQYIDLRSEEFAHNREGAVASLEEYHTLARNLVTDAMGVADYLNGELQRLYRVVEDLEQEDTNNTTDLKAYVQERISQLETLRTETQDLLNDLRENASQPVLEPAAEPADPVREAEETLEKLDGVLEPEGPRTPETSETSYNDGARKLLAIYSMLLQPCGVCGIPPAEPEKTLVVRAGTGPALLFSDLYRLARGRTSEMNDFCNNMEEMLRVDLKDQGTATDSMKDYANFIKSQTGEFEARRRELEKSFGWTEQDRQRIEAILNPNEE